jgi:hypothetical protein
MKPAPNGSKLKIGATNAEIGLVTGPNRIRVKTSGGLRSNLFVFTVQ